MTGMQNAKRRVIAAECAPFFCYEKKRAEAAVTCRHWQGDGVRGKRDLRRSGYAKMSL